jgi:hypothetical protein
MEQLTEHEVADAEQPYVEWKYILGLELRNAGLHCSVRKLRASSQLTTSFNMGIGSVR